MDRVHNLISKRSDAYRQAPWRRQLQFIGLFLIGLVLVALIAGVYLNLTARAAALGRDIQELQKEIETTEQQNADLQSRIAFLTSSDVMEQRAVEIGFRPMEMDEAIFVTVPGYQSRGAAILAPVSLPELEPDPDLPAEYTESIFSWLQRQITRSPLAGSISLPLWGSKE